MLHTRHLRLLVNIERELPLCLAAPLQAPAARALMECYDSPAKTQVPSEHQRKLSHVVGISISAHLQRKCQVGAIQAAKCVLSAAHSVQKRPRCPRCASLAWKAALSGGGGGSERLWWSERRTWPYRLKLWLLRPSDTARCVSPPPPAADLLVAVSVALLHQLRSSGPSLPPRPGQMFRASKGWQWHKGA